MEWRSLGPVAAGAVLLLGGAWRVAQSSGEGWPLLIMGVVFPPLGLYLFQRGEIYAKRTGLLKRAG